MTHYDLKLLEQFSRFGVLDSFAWLTHICGGAELLLKFSDQLPQEEQKRVLEDIARSAERCRQVLRFKNDAIILLTAKNYSGPSDLLNLGPLLQDFIDTCRRNAVANGQVIDIELEIASGLPLIVGNEQRLCYFLDILLNLLPTQARRTHGHLAVQKHEQDIQVTLQPLNIPTAEYPYLLSLLLQENGGGDLTIDNDTIRFILYGNR